MKRLIILCIALVASVGAAENWQPIDREESSRIHEKCRQENGVTWEQEQRILKKEHFDDKNVHDHILCVFKGMRVFTEDSGFIVDRLVAQFVSSHLNERTAREIVTKCVDDDDEKSAPALRAYRGLECLVNNRLYQLMQEAFDKYNENKQVNEI